MKDSTKDELSGKAHEVKGAVKEWVGKVTHNADLEAEGKAEAITGFVQKKAGQIEKVVEK